MSPRISRYLLTLPCSNHGQTGKGRFMMHNAVLLYITHQTRCIGRNPRLYRTAAEHKDGRVFSIRGAHDGVSGQRRVHVRTEIKVNSRNDIITLCIFVSTSGSSVLDRRTLIATLYSIESCFQIPFHTSANPPCAQGYFPSRLIFPVRSSKDPVMVVFIPAESR